METSKNTKANSAENSSSKENSSKKSIESKETKVEAAAAGTEESKEKLKDASTDQTSLAEGFCGFDEKDNPVQARSTKEASRNATVNLTKKSSAKYEKTEGKNDSPPDLVLFLKEGRGRAQSYSEPPRLDPESIATRRRTRVPEDPVALISKAKSASAEKTKKDQKGLIKKERKTIVMDTPESLKRLAREGSRQVQTTSKESSDSGSEEKALKKVHSKKNSEGDIKLKSASTSTRSEEEQPASISRKNSRGKRNSADKPEAEVVAENRATSPAKDSPDELINYSNLGSILNKMSRNVADKRIPVVIMSKSEKEPKTDSAKPKSKKRAPPDTTLSTAVLKMASPMIPPFLDDDETLSGSEDEFSTPKPEDERCGSPSSRGTTSDSETDENVIVLKRNSDVRSEEENRMSNTTKTGSSPSSDPNSSSREKVDVKQNIIFDNKEQANNDNESSQSPGTKETAISEPCGSGALDAVQGSSSYIKLSSAASSVRPGTVTMPIRSGQAFRPIRPNLLLPKPVTSLIKPNLVTSLSEPNTDTSPIRLSQLVTQVTSSQSTSLSKTSSIASHAKSSPITPLIRSVSVVPEVKTNSGTPPIKPSLVASHAKPSPSTSLVNPISVVSEVKSSSVPLPIKPRPLPSQVTPTPSTSQVKPNLGVSHSKPSPVTSQIKSSSFISHHTHVKPTLSTSPIQSNPFMSQVKSSPSSSPVRSNLVMSQVRPSLVPSHLKSSSLFSRVKPSPVASPIKSTLVVSQVKPSPVSSPLNSTPIASIKSSSIISPIKSGSGTSSCLQGQNASSFVGSKPKGSMKMTNLASSKMGVKASSNMKATSTTQTPKREITAKQDSYKCSQVPASEAASSLSQKDPMLDYTDIETEEVVLGENEDSSGQIDKVGDMPSGLDLLAHEELESSSEEDTVKISDQPVVPKKESLSPEGRVALDHSYSSGGSGNSRKKSPTTYEKSLTPRPVYSNASPAKRSLDIMLHNDKINILRQMSQIFNDEKPPLEIFSDEKDTQPDTDNSMSSSDGDEETNTVIRQTEENTTTMSSTKTINNISADPDNKDVKMKKTTKSSTMIQEDGNSSEAMSSKPLAVEEVPKPSGALGTSSEVNSSENASSKQEKTTEVQKTPPQKDRNGKNILQDAGNIITDSPFLGFPDPDPKVHHVPAYSPSLNEKISVQSKVGPSGEVIDIVDGFSFMSFSSENEMMSYDGTYSGKTMKTRHWLKRKRRRRKRLIRLKGRRMYPKVLREEPGPSVAGSTASPRERGATAECGAFASDDLDRFLVKNSHLNISYPIPKCKVTEDGVTKIDEEVLEPPPPPQTQTRPMSPHSPYAPDSSPGSPSSPHTEVTPNSTQPVSPVNPNSSAVEHTGAEAVPQYEEVNAIDILYPKEKYKYYYNKELCKETKADGSNVFVQRAGKLVPLTTIFKSQKSPSSEQPSTTNKQSVELVYVYDGGKLLTLGGSLTKINPSNSDCVRARVVLPMGVPPITKGETVAARAKKVQAVEINEDLAKFALSALQSSHLKLEQTADAKGDSEELPPLPGPSSDRGNEEEMDVDTPPVAPVDKVEDTDAPKIVPSPLPIKPTKRNILDIIAAKLAMSDDESDGKEDVEEKDAFGDLKESDKEIDMDISQITKHVVAGEKEEGKTVIKEEDDEANIDQGSIVTSVKGKIPLLKQEDLKEEKANEEVATKPEVSMQKEDMKTETGVEEDVTQTTKDTQRFSARREKEEEDGNEIVYVEEIREVIDLENSENNDPESDTNLEEKDKKDGESKSITKKEEKVKSNLMNLKENHNKNDGPQEQKNLNTSEAGDNKEPAVREEENINSVKKQSVNLDRKETGESKAAVVERNENSALIERGTVTESKASTPVAEENTGNPSDTYNDEALESLPSSGNTSRAESVINEAPRSSLLMSSQESGDKTDTEEKAEGSLESGGQEAFRMDIKSKVFKKNMYRFPSLSREMKRLNMNFVSYEPPPHEGASEEKEEVVQEVKGDCSNEHCKLGCVCDSLLCQRKSVEHCGRVECMFECTCRDESWKLPSGSGRTMNAVSIFNLDREQKEGLALREKDFKRTVIQTGSEVILVGAERKKREIRLPGRYRGTTVWEASEFPENSNYFMPPDHPLQPDYPGIPLSEASKYIKKFKLNIPWFDIKGISIWCMDHNCYDCRCLTDPTFNDPIQVESPKKITSPKAKPESSPRKCDESFTSTLSALVDFDEALKHKISDSPSSTNDVELKVPFVADANCSIMNIIVNNSETRRKYTWKLKEWYHQTGYFSARTAGYSKNKITEETKNMTLSGNAAKETTPEQIVESVVRSLRQQKANDELKLPSLPCDNNFEPFMGDSLINLQNAIGFDPENMKKTTETEADCLKKHLTSGSEDTTISRLEAELKSNIHCRPPKDLKGVVKRRGSGLAEPPLKKKRINKFEEGLRIVQADSTTLPFPKENYPANPTEYLSCGEVRVPKKTLSLLEMMVDEEKRGELELDLSSNIPGNALLVAEARFRKLINMNIIGVVGINKAGRCIIGTVDSDGTLQVMHQIQNMIRNNTLDVGPNMREIFFPPPYNGIRPRFVMIRCDSHRKWEIVGVVQKKGPLRAPSRASEVKAKATPSTKPQVIDLEEEERQKQLAGQLCNIKQEVNFDIIEPPSPDEKDGGDWEGSLPMIASVHSASDFNMAELIGSPETTQEEPGESHLEEESQVTKLMTSPTQKALPDLVPISSASLPIPSLREEEDGLSLETQITNSENSSQQKLYFVPTAFNVPSSTPATVSSVNTDMPMKSMTLNLASNKVFGDNIEKLPPTNLEKLPPPNIENLPPPTIENLPLPKLEKLPLPKIEKLSLPKMEKLPLPTTSLGGKKISYILPKIPGLGKIDTNAPPSTQETSKYVAEEHDTGQTVGAPASSSSKMLYIPVTSTCVSKVLFVPSVSSGSSQRMMLLPTLSGTNPLDTSSSTTSIPSTNSTATVTTSKMKMVLVPSPQDSSKMLLIPAAKDGGDGAAAAAAGTSSIRNTLNEGEKKKMLVLTPSVINNLVSKVPSSDTLATEPYQTTCSGTLFVPLNNTGILPTNFRLSGSGKDTQTLQESSSSQDNSDEIVVLTPTTTSLPITGMMMTSESTAVEEETPSLFSLAPVASSSGVAETNVVSSLTTISSTMPENASHTDDGISPKATSQDKQHVPADSLNTLLNRTHEEMVTGTEPIEEGLAIESVKDTGCEKSKNKPPVTKLIIHSQNPDVKKKEDTLDQDKKQLLIKKGGFHWSAVDLSINFKSVKLEWLLGTIRKNVLMNIYRMSKTTHSPVTLSVKNGTSTSMLYGFARYGTTSTLPILILGSVVSAVLSSSSVPDSMLFQINSIKYFIRESTGELSSYTYSSETHLVKLASKKRGNGGEMVGVGEQIEIYKLRDPAYQTQIEKYDIELGKASGSFSSMPGSCTCTEAGHLMCKGYCASGSSSQRGRVEATSRQDSIKCSSSRVTSEDESQYGSLGPRDTSLGHIHPKEEYRFQGNPRLPTLKELLPESQRPTWNKSRNMSKMIKRKAGKKKARLESHAQAFNVDNNQPNLEEGKSIIPKVECVSEEEVGDIDVLGDLEDSPSILSDLWNQLECETSKKVNPNVAVQKRLSSIASSGESSKRKGSKVQLGGPLMKKMRTGVSSSRVEQPCPRSRKPSVLGKIRKSGMIDKASSLEEGQGKDNVDPSSKCPTHLEPSVAGDISVANEEEDSDTIILSKERIAIHKAKRSMLYAAITRSRQTEERNSEVHNKLERMRRKVMRHLFIHLEKIIVKIPGNALQTRSVSHAKKTVLCSGQRVCEILKNEELQLTMEEERVRNERSALIKKLAAIIGDSTEEIKLKWRKWVRENMQNPTAKQAFELIWQPFCLEKDILNNALEGHFDMDYDGGSPLPAGSPLLGSTSSQSSGDNRVVGRKITRPPGRRKRVLRKRGKKLGRPFKIQSNQGPGGIEDTSTIPTSILLMAGTSSRGRKIVRKEDMNFVT